MNQMKKVLASLLAVVMLLGLLPIGVLAAEEGTRYSDTEGHWANEAIENWSDYGVISGSNDGAFYPDNAITRGEMAKIIATALCLEEIGENIFEDLDESAWYAESVLKCYAAGIMIGDGEGHVFPTAQITRQEASKMLAVALGIAPVETEGDAAFNDAGDIDDWAAPYVEALRRGGYINGVGDDRFEPKWFINRASVVTILNNAVAAYITEPGTYSGDFDGIVIITCDDVILENSAITGNVIVTGTHGEAGEGKNVVIQNSKIEGNLIVLGEDEADGSVKLVGTEVSGTVVAPEGVVEESAAPPIINKPGNSGGGDPSTPSVASVAVTPAKANVQKGATQQFTATATPSGVAQTVTWSIVESVDAGTTIDASGLLTVAAEETLTTLTIKATSTVATSKSGTATVEVMPDGVVLATDTAAAPIVLDAKYNQYDGLYLIAEAVAGDIEMVTDSRPAIIQDAQEIPTTGVVIVAGEVDDSVIADLDLEWDIATTDWERYQTQVVTDGELTKVVVAGSDKRGTMYGLFRISQDLGGVSPWVYWGDVTPVTKSWLVFTAEELEYISETPSVQYRGIFFNDEAPL